ncbi:MAG: PaaI family thioesterase, partial [Candidatus Binataceae bacterium]
MATSGAAHDAVLSELEQGPFSSALGLKVEARAEGDVTVRMPFSEGILNTGGPGVPIHGGAIASLADFAACAAVWTLSEARSSATISMTVNYTAPAVKTDLIARARIRRAGKRIASIAVEIRDQQGALIADA